MTPMEQQRRLSSSSLYMQHTHNNETFITKKRSIMQSVDCNILKKELVVEVV